MRRTRATWLSLALVATMGATCVTAAATLPGSGARLLIPIASGNGHFLLASVNADGSGRHVYRGPGFRFIRGPYGLLPSPDGRRVICTCATPHGRQGIWTTELSGRQSRLVYPTSGDAFPAWSPDGRKILFAGPGSLEVMDADGHHLHRLGTEPVRGIYPQWSPDGRTIAFLHPGPHQDPAAMADGSVWAVPSRGGTPHLAFEPPTNTGVRSFDWAPDGRRLVVDLYDSRPCDGTDGLCEPGQTIEPRSAFVGINVIHRDGSGLRTLLRTGFLTTPPPTWSPDGKRIMVALETVAPGGSPVRGVWTLNPAGGGLRKIPGVSSAIAWLPGPRRDK